MSETGTSQADLLAQLLGVDRRVLNAVASQNAMANFNTLPIGVSGATAGNVFNPETMLLTGAFNPAQFTAAIDSKYNQMLMDYQSKVDRAIQRPYEATLGSIGLDETFYNPSSEIGELMQDAVNSIAMGEQTAAGALERINSIIDTLPPEVAANIDRISKDLTQFEEKDLPRYRDAVKKYEYDAAQAMANLGISEPTRQDAKLEFYSDLGMPQLALLPDPTEQYQIDPFIFAKPEEAERRRKAIAKSEETIASETAKFSKELAAEQGIFGQMRRIQDVGRRALSKAEQAKQDYLAKNMTKDNRDLISRGLDFAGGSPIIGGLFGGNQRQKEVNKINQAAQAEFDRVYSKEMSKNLAKPYVTQGGKKIADLSPAARAARDEKLKNEMYLRIVEGITKPKAAAAQAALTKAGITPWQQAMDQMLRNAQAMSTKLK